MSGVYVPVKAVNGENWGRLSVFGNAHLVVAEETPKQVNDSFSFAGGHRVRAWKFKKNVHWRPIGIELEISDIPPAGPARRRHRHR